MQQNAIWRFLNNMQYCTFAYNLYPYLVSQNTLTDNKVILVAIKLSS